MIGTIGQFGIDLARKQSLKKLKMLPILNTGLSLGSLAGMFKVFSHFYKPGSIIYTQNIANYSNVPNKRTVLNERTDATKMEK